MSDSNKTKEIYLSEVLKDYSWNEKMEKALGLIAYACEESYHTGGICYECPFVKVCKANNDLDDFVREIKYR